MKRRLQNPLFSPSVPGPHTGMGTRQVDLQFTLEGALLEQEVFQRRREAREIEVEKGPVPAGLASDRPACSVTDQQKPGEEV